MEFKKFGGFEDLEEEIVGGDGIITDFSQIASIQKEQEEVAVANLLANLKIKPIQESVSTPYRQVEESLINENYLTKLIRKIVQEELKKHKNNE